ncbi:MAG: DsbA family oxidoreductase [Nevskia sp.]|nr:DsbA family oxidoreductase [Nevskia sp.]
MKSRMKIDFVSDVSCPWCAIGLKSLEQALARVDDRIEAELHFQPFELNPQMPPEGQDIVEHIRQKYGSSASDVERNRAAIRQRGAEVGFTFNMEQRGRIYNTFDAHRLLHWAALEGRQQVLKEALLRAYFGEGRNPADHQVLVEIAQASGLDPLRAKAILESDEYAAETRAQEQFYLDHGIHSVPAIVINQRHLISGGQPVEVFERALLQIAAESSAA